MTQCSPTTPEFSVIRILIAERFSRTPSNQGQSSIERQVWGEQEISAEIVTPNQA
ncbi:MAG: hypothetical protein PUP92_33775 [Rhizonema sp. PD38]|nr:hypothetical protein [Rhizonema sp. PD38]